MSLLLKKFRILIWSFSEFPYYNVGDITSAKGYPHYDWPATYSVSLFINNLYTVTYLIVKLVTKRRKSNNQIVLNCLHQHNLMTIEGPLKDALNYFQQSLSLRKFCIPWMFNLHSFYAIILSTIKTPLSHVWPWGACRLPVFSLTVSWRLSVSGISSYHAIRKFCIASATSSQYLCRRIKITINHKYHALGEHALPSFLSLTGVKEAVASPLIIIARLFPRPEYSLFSHSFVARGWSAPLFFTCQPCRPYTPV